MTLFENLALWVDDVPRDGPAQMALDEALLGAVRLPTLRVYCWAGPAVSFGCSQSLAAVRAQHPTLPLVRRWTGGGMVEHLGDWTFSLVVPTSEALAALRPAETYRRIHESLRPLLEELGTATRLVGKADCRAGAACFSAPALYDLRNERGEKLCGGAQRRTRRGFLHQGSVQRVVVPADFGPRVAAALAVSVSPAGTDPTLAERAGELVREKYATPAWEAKIP